MSSVVGAPFIRPAISVSVYAFAAVSAIFADPLASAPTSLAVYVGFVAALAHSETSDAGSEVGKSVISDFV